MYKKIYLEITNSCNLNCSFCIKNNRNIEFMSINNFKKILTKIKKYTKYLYLHVSGEPLLHPKINELIDIAKNDFFINITTNGYLIKRIKDNHNIRQINISMHSYNPINNLTLEEYLNNIVDVINNLKDDTFFSLRFWVNNKYNMEIKNYLEKIFKKPIEIKDGFKIAKNVFISVSKEFIWPSLDNGYENKNGTCYSLKDHIGILVNGDVVPCCLDVNGIIKLGNIFETDLESIINSNLYQEMLKGFNNNKKIEKLCQKCNFLNRLN